MVVAGRRIYAFRPYIFCPPFPAAPAAADKARDFGAGPLFNQNLPLLESRLTSWFEESSTRGRWTSNAVQITRGRIRQGLKPFIITRDLRWGTPVPNERFRDKVFYW